MKPLLISDCDEVLVSFAAPFGAHLEEAHNMRLRLDSFALSGNVRHMADDSPVADDAMPDLLMDFFRTGMHRQTAAPGAAEALAALDTLYDIVILTNIEDEHRERRKSQVRALGMDYEVYCNRGPKGPALKRILEAHGSPPAVFMDDLPPHHQSVKTEVPHVHCIHMVADAQLRQMIPPAAHADARIDDWPDARVYLERLINEENLARTGVRVR
ncbi:HAD family hydrolase [Pacificimonas sp. WHA3]|uniref:HAD family hydrolase n=1 Tax=Pacificimonas pallii TaxID=2827236 RepID=A0ABS6SH33_9SPHN|nr:HAD family hydrolase [Pacificimonas pallii]MBV7257735.1 HAD family hydrolase [Pacificimonas pallii]